MERLGRIHVACILYSRWISMNTDFDDILLRSKPMAEKPLLYDKIDHE